MVKGIPFSSGDVIKIVDDVVGSYDIAKCSDVLETAKLGVTASSDDAVVSVTFGDVMLSVSDGCATASKSKGF